MRLTANNLAFYLVDKGFLSPEYLISGKYRVIQQQNRNIIFRVELGETDPGLFIKQLLSFDAHNSYTLQKEATALYLFQNSDTFADLTPYLTAYHGYDSGAQVLVTEYLPQALDLNEWIQHHKTFPQQFTESIATMLSILHRDISGEIAGNTSLQFFRDTAPWILRVGDPVNPFLHHTANANPVAHWIGQNAPLCAALENLRVGWRGTSLIHGDVKLVNFIMPSPESEQLKLVDWEICALGNALWDVAGILQSVLCTWLSMNTPQHPGQNSDRELPDISAVKAFNSALWHHYRRSMRKQGRLEIADDIDTLLRFCGARLLQSSYEMNVYSQQLTPQVTHMLGYVQWLLTEPRQMANLLLGDE